MSNVSIIERIRTLADQLESRAIGVQDVAESLLGHVEALEGMNYSRIKEAQWLSAQLSNAIANGEMDTIDTDAVVGFLRQWTLLVSQENTN
jgi:hypothetical protein